MPKLLYIAAWKSSLEYVGVSRSISASGFALNGSIDTSPYSARPTPDWEDGSSEDVVGWSRTFVSPPLAPPVIAVNALDAKDSGWLRVLGSWSLSRLRSPVDGQLLGIDSISGRLTVATLSQDIQQPTTFHRILLMGWNI